MYHRSPAVLTWSTTAVEQDLVKDDDKARYEELKKRAGAIRLAQAAPIRRWAGHGGRRAARRPPPHALPRAGREAARGGRSRVPLDPGSPTRRRSNRPTASNPRGRRTALANWLADPDNPLTAARDGQSHLAASLRPRHRRPRPATSACMGDAPDAPRAARLAGRRIRGSGWSIKHLHRLIVHLERLPPVLGVSRGGGAKVDPDEQLLWRFPPAAPGWEVIRDSMLASPACWIRRWAARASSRLPAGMPAAARRLGYGRRTRRPQPAQRLHLRAAQLAVSDVRGLRPADIAGDLPAARRHRPPPRRR